MTIKFYYNKGKDMKKNIIVAIITFLVLIGTNICTYVASEYWKELHTHPIERAFNKLPKGYQLFFMSLGLQVFKESKQRQLKPKTKKVEI